MCLCMCARMQVVNIIHCVHVRPSSISYVLSLSFIHHDIIGTRLRLMRVYVPSSLLYGNIHLIPCLAKFMLKQFAFPTFAFYDRCIMHKFKYKNWL